MTLKGNLISPVIFLSPTVTLIAFFVAACAQPSPKPVAIDEEIDACMQCGMSVKDAGYAAELIDIDGVAFKFDDIGCLILWQAERPEKAVIGRWVQDMETREWIMLDQAFFVYSPHVPTPMAYGIHAFEDGARAGSFSAMHVESKSIGLADILSLLPKARVLKN